MKRISFSKALFMVTLSILFLLAGCGGSGKGSGTTGNTYTGETSQATVTQSNAHQIMQDAFLDGISGSGFAAAFGAIDANQMKEGSTPIFRYLSRPAKTIARLVTDRSYDELPRSISAVQTVPINEPGECGGTISGSEQVDDVTGSMTGSLTYSNYCEMGSVSNGTVAFSGTYNLNNGNLDMTMTFNNFTEVSSAESLSITMNGTVIMVSTGSSDSMTFNITVSDDVAGKTYWMEDYLITDSSSDSEEDIEISGNFYSPDYGYVTLSTQQTFIILTDDDYPSSGILIATGAGGTKARLTALSSTTYEVEADTNGDGNYELVGTFSWGG